MNNNSENIVLETYRKCYEEAQTFSECIESKHEWIATNVFGLATYDAGLDKIFVDVIFNICKVILEQDTYEFIESSDDNYIVYILVCQLLDRMKWIEWGTSIRGAWFAESYYDISQRPQDILDDGNYVIPFTKDNLRTLIEFYEEKE